MGGAGFGIKNELKNQHIRVASIEPDGENRGKIASTIHERPSAKGSASIKTILNKCCMSTTQKGGGLLRQAPQRGKNYDKDK